MPGYDHPNGGSYETQDERFGSSRTSGWTYQNAVCRGSWNLGTACGKCERCEETRPGKVKNMVKVRTTQTIEFDTDAVKGLIKQYVKLEYGIDVKDEEIFLQAQEARFDEGYGSYGADTKASATFTVKIDK